MCEVDYLEAQAINLLNLSKKEKESLDGYSYTLDTYKRKNTNKL